MEANGEYSSHRDVEGRKLVLKFRLVLMLGPREVRSTCCHGACALLWCAVGPRRVGPKSQFCLELPLLLSV